MRRCGRGALTAGRPGGLVQLHGALVGVGTLHGLGQSVKPKIYHFPRFLALLMKILALRMVEDGARCGRGALLAGQAESSGVAPLEWCIIHG